MDNQNNNTGSDWLDEILGTTTPKKELGPDEMAVAAAGLSHPDDAELEKIIQETLAENWSEEPAQEQPAPVPARRENPARKTASEKKPAPKKQPAKKPAREEANEPVPAEAKAPAKKAAKAPAKPKNAFLAFFAGFKKSTDGERLWGLPHIISSLIWLVVIVAIGASIGRLGWLCATDVLALGKTPKQVVLILGENEDISSVANKLQKEGLIKYPALFELFANFTNKADNMLTGAVTFTDEIVYDYNALCNTLTHKKTTKATVEVMIPEGYSCAQIFKLLEDKGVCKAEDLEEYAATGELEEYWFLEEVKRGHKYCLEGFLFPDTYEFYVGDTPKRVLEKFLNDFDYRFNNRMQEKFKALNENLKLDMSIREVVIMASIIEKEKANHLEGYTISSVFYNRLTHAASYPFLNSDATLLYDVEYYTGRMMSDTERAKSPYNTYTQRGLPAGPIANPGMGSIDAALAPETTNYYYFIYDKSAGYHLFSKNLSEHQKKAKELGLA